MDHLQPDISGNTYRPGEPYRSFRQLILAHATPRRYHLRGKQSRVRRPLPVPPRLGVLTGAISRLQPSYLPSALREHFPNLFFESLLLLAFMFSFPPPKYVAMNRHCPAPIVFEPLFVVFQPWAVPNGI